MLELFRSLAIHQARFHRVLLDSWGNPEARDIDDALDSLVYDVTWLTKLPLLWTPTFALKSLDALNKAWPGSSRDPASVQAAAAVIADVRPRVDADTPTRRAGPVGVLGPVQPACRLPRAQALEGEGVPAFDEGAFDSRCG